MILLTATQVVSYIDRFLPSLLMEAIKKDLALTDFQIGLLIGPAFGVFYVIVGLPIGWLADRFSRRTILATGIAIWCSMTAAAGFAKSFLPLFATRMGVGLGEAAVAPCALSLISDHFPRTRRARAISVFMAGTFIGAGSAYLFGGPIAHEIAEIELIQVPLFGDLKPWQATFLIVGLPGLLLSGLMFTIREPTRKDRVAGVHEDEKGRTTLLDALRFIAPRWRAFGTLFAGSACCVTLGALSLWNVALFGRTWNWTVRDVGITTGLLFFICGSLGTLMGMWLTQHWIKQQLQDATMRALLTGLIIAVTGFAIYPIVPTAQMAVAALFVAFIGQAIATAAGPASLTMIAPGQIRSQSTAIYYFVISISGQLLGPPPVGWMTDLFGDPTMLRYAMSIEALVVGIPAMVLVTLGLASYRRQATELEAQLVEQQQLREAVAHA